MPVDRGIIIRRCAMSIRTIILRFLGTVLLLSVQSVAVGAVEKKPRVREQAVSQRSSSPFARLHSVPVGAVTLGDGLWNTRFRTNADVSIPAFYKHLESVGALDKVRGRENKARGNSDADLAKWIEAASFVLQSEENETVGNLLAGVVSDISTSASDGDYLHARYMLRMPSVLADLKTGGYLYCLGHLLQAAIAYRQATEDDRLLDVFVPYVDNVIDRFGPGKEPCWSGHPEIELALVELYKTTGRRKYLDFAHYLLEEANPRGPEIDLGHYFAHTPLSSQQSLSGHAVCALYRCCGAADFYLETGDKGMLDALMRLWLDLTRHKMYVTGGVGSRPADEAIGDPYELPNERGYAETCAAIANIMWNRRMLSATGQARFADVMELALYNGFLSGVSIDGRDYFYWNPLLSRAGEIEQSQRDKDENPLSVKKSTGIGSDVRRPYYQTPCCVPNAQRMIASLPGYMYGASSEGVWIHLYHNSRLNWHLDGGQGLTLVQNTKYPWDGGVEITLESVPSDSFSLFLRIPYWTGKTRIAINGRAAAAVEVPGSYHEIRRKWRAGDRVEVVFDMLVRTVYANPSVRENRGRITLQRGPLVCCLESVDHPGMSIFDIVLPADVSSKFTAEFEPETLGGIVTIKGAAMAHVPLPAGAKLYSFTSFRESLQPVSIKAIPYFAWANRGPSEMTVWVSNK